MRPMLKSQSLIIISNGNNNTLTWQLHIAAHRNDRVEMDE